MDFAFFVAINLLNELIQNLQKDCKESTFGFSKINS